ncbi:MAG: hypothetical protein HC781_02630 [Leptolyngbyaceae cyanobacterium CSU_1_4]|nr:hypothetical protein [Leptolyngbyaceae cyanobacterium CSU_1_4]
MRSAHTLKGAAASVGVESMKAMAHSLEDVFKSLYNPDVIVDSELEGLLLEAYECLRMPVTAAIAGSQCNNAEVLQQADSVFKRLKAKLGKNFDPGASIPTSAELGFDITQSIFESGVDSRLEELEGLLTGGDGVAIAKLLQVHADVFLGLAESLNLSGFGAIAKTTIQAINTHPDQILTIAHTALADFRQGQMAVFAGDRIRGGEPSSALKQLAQKKPAKKPTLDQPAQKIPRKNPPKNLIRQYPRVQQLLKMWKHLINFLNQPIKAPGFCSRANRAIRRQRRSLRVTRKGSPRLKILRSWTSLRPLRMISLTSMPCLIQVIYPIFQACHLFQALPQCQNTV